MPGGPQVPSHLPGTVERRLQELAVDQRHQGEVLGALAPSLMVIARSADRDEPALTGKRQLGVVGPDLLHQVRPTGPLRVRQLHRTGRGRDRVFRRT